MTPYHNYNVYYGDIHTHCGISYGHGTLEDALKNARQQLDFCSVTGHAHWHDMPEPDERIQYIIDFHREGFAKLKKGWNSMMRTLKEYNREEEFLVFPGFEIHSNSDGDRTVVYKDIKGEIIYANNVEQLHNTLRKLKNEKGLDSLTFPHHIGYKKGTRGINWKTFSNEFAPVVEMISMHGCSEKSDNPRPFLHSMGPADWESTIQYGLQQGHIFGFCGNTDHHSAHPGSYGHGRTGVWSEDQTRDALWEAFYSRRTYALTGDKIDLKFSINHSLMGSIIPESDEKNIDISVSAGTAIDYVDIVKDNQLLKRFSQCDIDNKEPDYNVLKTKVYLELGWGERNKTTDWKVELELTEGKILSVEPRFRGEEVVSPVEKKDNFSDFYTSSCKQLTDKSIEFKTTSQANPNNFTCTTQGVCLEVKTTLNTAIKARINDKTEVVPLKRLLKGSYTGRLSLIGSPSYKFNRAPLPSEFNWSLNFQDKDTSRYFDIGHSFYYVRVRQQNDQWAWSSPIFIKV